MGVPLSKKNRTLRVLIERVIALWDPQNSRQIRLNLTLLFKIFIFLCAIASLPYLQKSRTLSDKLASKFLTDILIETKTIKIDGNTKTTYNPSIISYEDGYLMLFRLDHPYDFNLKRLKKYRWKKFNTSNICLALLDTHFNLKGEYQVLQTKTDKGRLLFKPENARIIRHQDDLYIVFNHYVINKPSGCHQMYMSKLHVSKERFYLEPCKKLAYPSSKRNCEKNWMPFIHHDELHFVYNINPHIILKPDLNTGMCRPVTQINPQLPWQFGKPRGGTPVIDDGDKYITFFHSVDKTKRTWYKRRRKRIYLMGAYTFEKEFPFRMIAMTPAPIGMPENYSRSKNRKGVMYPTGAVMENDRIILSYGENDRSIKIGDYRQTKTL